ncbi:MAG: MFS transporter, partial [Chloroflexi bacterium]|nr:MFS transporter [Chloroflexota bacterium]
TPVWGLLFGLNGLLIVLFQLRIATATERRSKPRVMAVAVCLYAIGLAPVALLSPSTAIVGLAIAITLVTVGEMLLMPVVAAFVSDLSPVSRRGIYQGIALAASGIGSGIGPPVAGYVLDASHGQGLWLVAAAILVVAGVGFLVLAKWTDRLPTADASTT